MNKALALVFDVFGLEDRGYVMTAFKDKGNRCSIELANEDFTVDVDIKNCERFGLIENEE